MKRIILTLIIYMAAVCLVGENGPKHEAFEAYAVVKYHLSLYDFDKAEDAVDQFLAKHPDDPFILTEKAYMLKEIKNKPEEALTLLKKVQTIYPEYYYSNYLYASLLFWYATAGRSIEEDDPAALRTKAVKYLEKSLKDNAGYYDSAFLMGLILSDRGDYKGSNKYLEKAGGLKQTPEPHFYMAENYNKLKDYDNEVRAHEKVLYFSPYNSKSLIAVSRYHLERGDAQNAAIYLEKLFAKYPDDKKISFDYLRALFTAKKVDKFLEVSGGIDVSHSRFLIFARAFFLSQKKRYTEAVKLLVSLKERGLRANLLLAEIYKRKKDYYEAYRVLAGIKDGENNSLFYSLKIEMLSLLNMNRRLLGLFEKIKDNDAVMAEFTPGDYYNVLFAYSNLNRTGPLPQFMAAVKARLKIEPEPLKELHGVLDYWLKKSEISADKIGFNINGYLIVNFYKQQKKYADAVSLLNQIIKKDKEAGVATYMELCDIYINRKQAADAEQLIKKMKKIFPRSVEVKNFHAYFLAVENRQLERALKLSEATLAADGESSAYLDTYGYILFKMGRVREALQYLEKAYQKNPFEPEIMEHLVECYRVQKNTGKILEIYQRAIDNGVDFKDRLLEKLKTLKQK
ncbi:MAG: tetratricopeptide repeat protein [bacterium]|nr:tetratricopeptide repeat protein [bacterium]